MVIDLFSSFTFLRKSFDESRKLLIFYLKYSSVNVFFFKAFSDGTLYNNTELCIVEFAKTNLIAPFLPSSPTELSSNGNS
ncbi:hypothetical protein DAPPUDRAFT_302461 [Daphnia pulex]|uniref:Uncharacterized protein n=1 Tax=Daphnia pulex TaxID=6669 RepID=E9I216_DAPPU|nr:hypothetical protein DAPPUDRAFT_302461 [Daphnia pulex]|eukprot:EFX61965.1 hypothetical protein DAPPUDRAFT_302461 [Daphnia pulex]